MRPLAMGSTTWGRPCAAWSVRVATLAALVWMSVAQPTWALHDEAPRLPEAGKATDGPAAPAEAAVVSVASPVKPWPAVSSNVAPDTLLGGAVPWASLMAPPSLGALMQGGGSGGGPTFEYYALDALGSVRVVFDATGAVKARADYEPFGSPITASTTGPLPREQFTGQQRDGEVGLDYFGARFYHAAHGRMLSVDPLYVGAVANPQRWNRYAYGLNSPANLVDPDGRCAEPVSDTSTTVCRNGPLIDTPSAGQPPLLGNFGVASTDPYNYYDVQYGPGYRPDPMGGVRVGKPSTNTTTEVGEQVSDADSGGRVDYGEPPAPEAGPMVAQLVQRLAPVVARIQSQVAMLAGRLFSFAGGRPGIALTEKGVAHVLARHLPGGAHSAGKSLFSVGAKDVLSLVQRAESVAPTLQKGGNFQRIVNAGRAIGVDRATGAPTSIYTVITNKAGELVTAFPGIP